MDVDQHHPTPRAQNEPKPGPATCQSRTEQWKPFERTQRRLEPFSRVIGKAVGADAAIEVLARARAQLDPCHGLALIQHAGLPGRSLPAPKLRAIERPRAALRAP